MSQRPTIESAQVRAGRAMARLSVTDLARLAAVPPDSVIRVEAERPVHPATLGAILQALEGVGVSFTGNGCVCHAAGDD